MRQKRKGYRARVLSRDRKWRRLKLAPTSLITFRTASSLHFSSIVNQCRKCYGLCCEYCRGFGRAIDCAMNYRFSIKLVAGVLGSAVVALIAAYLGQTVTGYDCVRCRTLRMEHRAFGFSWQTFRDAEFTEWYRIHGIPHQHQWERFQLSRAGPRLRRSSPCLRAASFAFPERVRGNIPTQPLWRVFSRGSHRLIASFRKEPLI